MRRFFRLRGPDCIVVFAILCILAAFVFADLNRHDRIRAAPVTIKAGTTIAKMADRRLVVGEAVLLRDWSRGQPYYHWKIGVPGTPQYALPAVEPSGSNVRIPAWIVGFTDNEGLHVVRLEWAAKALSLKPPIGPELLTPPSDGPDVYNYKQKGLQQ